MRLVFGSRAGDLVGLQDRALGEPRGVQLSRIRLPDHSCEQAEVGGAFNQRLDGSEYLAQDIQSREISDQRRGYYAVIGFSEPVQRYLGTMSPSLMRAKRLRRCKEADEILQVGTIGIQIDVAFEVGREYPNMHETVSVEAASTAVKGVYPALVTMRGGSPRLAKYGDVSSVEFHLEASTLKVADVSSNMDVHSVVNRHGRPILDMTSMLVRPINAFAWAAQSLQRKGQAFRVGDVVTSGTFPLLLDIKSGDQLVVDLVCHAISNTYRWRAP